MKLLFHTTQIRAHGAAETEKRGPLLKSRLISVRLNDQKKSNVSRSELLMEWKVFSIADY